MKINFIGLGRGFFYLFFAFVPFSINALVWSKEVFVSGFFNPYLSHFIYLSDVFLVLSLLFLGASVLFGEKLGFKNWKVFGFLDILLLIFIIMACVGLFFSVDWQNSLIGILRFLEFFAVYFLISRNFVDLKILFYIFVGVIGLVSVIGILQYLLQHSIGLNFLGEPVLSPDMLGVAKIDLLDKQIIRAYGTFSHPNIFAGYLLLGIFVVIYLLKISLNQRYVRWIFGFLLAIFAFALISTFSRSAFLALILAVGIYGILFKFKIKWKYILSGIFVAILLIFIFDLFPVLWTRFVVGDSSAFSERMNLLGISKMMFLDHPFGVGLGNFTEVMQNFSSEKLMPWNFQPVHNIYLLVLNEMGIYGFAVLIFVFVYSFYGLRKKRNSKNFPMVLLILFSVFVIGLFDHYFVSLYQGQVLLWMIFGLADRRIHFLAF